jgi:hypothetical protein
MPRRCVIFSLGHLVQFYPVSTVLCRLVLCQIIIFCMTIEVDGESGDNFLYLIFLYHILDTKS